MDFGNAGNGTGSSDDKSGNEQHYRHSPYQIQRLEQAFNTCSHPNKTQRLHLGMELRFEPKRVKYWFQNRRTQAKAQRNKADLCYLKIENEKLKQQNLELEEALRRRTCRNCDVLSIKKDETLKQSSKEKLENEELKLKLANLKSVVASKSMEENTLGSLICNDQELANPLKLKLGNEEVKPEQERQLRHLANVTGKLVEQVQPPSCSLDLQLGLPGQGQSRDFFGPSRSNKGKEMNKKG